MGYHVTTVTPQGLLSVFDQGLTTWKSLHFVAPDSPTTPPSLAFNLIADPVQQALQSNQLFMVAADGALLLANTDLNYWLTSAALRDLTALPDSLRPTTAVMTKPISDAQ